MKHLEGVFLERKFDSDILCTIPKKPKSAFFSIEKAVFLPMQLESKKGHFEVTDEELVMIIKYNMNCRIRHHNFDKRHICSCIHVLNLVFFSLIFCVLPLLPVYSRNNHFGSSIFSPGYVFALFSLHLESCILEVA